MKYSNIPTPVEVVEKLRSIGGNAPAATLCRALTNKYFTHEAQLGIQRAMDARMIVVEKDLSLSVKFYPDDGGLGEQKKKFDDTFSAWTVIKNHFFPERN
jgi:hypothetical protein